MASNRQNLQEMELNKMTACSACGEVMKIGSFMLDVFGDGDDEFEFEACEKCKLIYFINSDWKILDGNIGA